MQLLHQLLAALLGERRNGQADDLAVVGRVEAQVGDADGLLDRPDLRNVPRLDGDQRRLGNVQVGNLVERRGRTVIVHADMIQESQGSAPGADGGHLVLQVRNGLFHARLLVGFDILDGVEAWDRWVLLAVLFS